MMASHLHPNRRAALSSTSPSLPGQTERLSASLFQKIYRSSTLAVRALNDTSLLTAYQAELMEEMGSQTDTGSPDSALWKEICVIADLNLRSSRGAVQSCGRSMGLAVVGERPLWLELSGLLEREKAEFLYAPVESKTLFGAAVTNMRQQCDLAKKMEKLLKLVSPESPLLDPPSPHALGFPLLPVRDSQGTETLVPPPQQSIRAEVNPRQPQPRGKASIVAAAAKHHPANPQGGKKRRAT